MRIIDQLSQSQKEELLRTLAQEYEAYCARGLKLNMARGVPGTDQLDMSEELLGILSANEQCLDNGIDVRSYGTLEGLPEARALMAGIMDVSPDELMIGGSSSLNLMFDMIARAVSLGVTERAKPWGRDGVKFLCPVPGYDRHFGVTGLFGFEMIPVPMTATGPNMDVVERLVKDESVKGMWCIPRYSNPTGVTYSDETVDRIAALSPASPDFRVFWDNAYAVHDLYDTTDPLKNVFEACRAAGHPELVIQFASTSKISFPGGGISAIAAGPQTLAWIQKCMFYQTICFDKINQLRHVRYFKNLDGVRAHMQRHAERLRPKFEAVWETFDENLTGWGDWTRPRGGYFISLDVAPGTAKKSVALLKRAGVQMTPAGATWPNGVDPEDKNIRVAPTYPSVSELRLGMELLCVCAKLAALGYEEEAI